MAEHRETFSEDVGSKLLLLASMLAVFGVIALVLMPLGAAFAPPAPPAATAASTQPAVPAEGTAPAPEAAVNSTDAPTPPAEATAAPAGPPPIIGAIFPGLIMLVVAAVLAALSGLLLGYAKARSEEGNTSDTATPH